MIVPERDWDRLNELVSELQERIMVLESCHEKDMDNASPFLQYVGYSLEHKPIKNEECYINGLGMVNFQDLTRYVIEGRPIVKNEKKTANITTTYQNGILSKKCNCHN